MVDRELFSSESFEEVTRNFPSVNHKRVNENFLSLQDFKMTLSLKTCRLMQSRETEILDPAGVPTENKQQSVLLDYADDAAVDKQQSRSDWCLSSVESPARSSGSGCSMSAAGVSAGVVAQIVACLQREHLSYQVGDRFHWLQGKPSSEEKVRTL